jgi:ABC-type antimicrobial peptide transport system permease subunit
VADRRLAALLGVTLALLTFGVALVGLSGAVVRAVEERRREIAIRGALGATPRNLVRLALSGVAGATVGGLALGLIGALATAGVLRSLIRGVGGYDVLTLGAVVCFVLACAAAVCYVPARRAARVDPAAALRSE